MGYTIRPILRKDKKNKDELCPVALCITINRQRIYHNLGIKVPEDYWNGKEVISSYPNANMYNVTIRSEHADLERKILKRGLEHSLTIKAAKALFRKDTGTGSFYDISKLILSEIGNQGTKRRYELEDRELKKYSPVLSFGDITPVFLNKYNKELLKDKDQNTVINAFKWIRKVFNYARDHGITTLYPFTEWEFPKYINKHKEYLTIEETEEIRKLLDRDIDLTIKKVAAYFLIECYSGLRFSDWSRFKIEKLVDGKSLKVITKKTNKPIFIPIDVSPRLSSVIDYIEDNEIVFGLTGEHTNRILKSVAALASIKKNLTTHTGRHTFATLLLEKGFSRETVALALGVSMKIVDVYARMTGQKVKNEFNNLGGL